MNLPLILNLLVFLALLLGLAQTRRSNWSLAKKVLLALGAGRGIRRGPAHGLRCR